MASFQLLLFDRKESICEAWRRAFAKYLDHGVSIKNCYLEELTDFDAIVSPANSFALMDRGVDASIIRKFGSVVQERAQLHILKYFQGEQPVGTCILVKTNDPNHPYVAHTPTMRVPYSIKGTDNVYLAMKAVLRIVDAHNKYYAERLGERPIVTLACSGMCTHYGELPPEEAARQMLVAYESFLRPPAQIDWGYADQLQKVIGYGGYPHFVQEYEHLTHETKEIECTMTTC